MNTPAIIFSDLHANKYNQFSEHHDRLKDCLRVIDDTFKYAQHYEASTILFCGDLVDNPKAIQIPVLTGLLTRFSKWFKKCPNITLYAISGNHDQSSKNYWETPAETALTAFATAFPSRFVLIDNDVAQIGDTDCYVAGIPYYENKDCFDQALNAQVERLQDKNDGSAVVTLLIHQTPEGIYNPHIKAETSPADPRYAAFDFVADGHIHQYHKLNSKFLIAGNGLHRDLGDIGSEKFIHLIDLASPAETHLPISRKGRYPELIRMPPDKITDEILAKSFVVPMQDKKLITVEGSADVSEFGGSLNPADLLTNYYKVCQVEDERLLAVGLSLLQ